VADDSKLYARWATGDREAGGHLIDRYLGQLGRFFSNKVVASPDTEDLVALTFEVCAKNLGKFRGESSFRTYLYGIARNVLRDYVKKRGRRPSEVDFRVTRVVDLGPSPSVILGERKEQALLLAAMRAIPLELQIVLELSFFEEMTQAQIAEVLDLPPGTVASRIRRGKTLLFEQIEALADTPQLLESTMHGLRDWARSIREHLDARDEPGDGEV
jgi:RNA polymerase sigma factor (sigma-70 family)